ncbi:hypothetical protein M408DRAFT_110820 [Serendipita vermifera MAFF 305830]|uniref:Uncharacterized protein n=1 Tax=Serendipita vermifera MAFF 305830 TaxID=933852 RepID=A0A0C3AMC1_SERVB|nr:hypothetical protein M408DRAFT_110820 [Serendipita vermifera MAFF 305830]
MLNAMEGIHYPSRRNVAFIGNWSIGDFFTHSNVGSLLGKTTLISVLCGDHFVPSSYISGQKGRGIRTTDIEVQGRLVKVDLWDTQAQEDHDCLRILVYPGCATVVFCFAIDSPESFASIQERWMPEILHFCSRPKVPIILVGCKKDSRQKNGESQAMQQGKLITSERGRELATSIHAVEYFECAQIDMESIHELKEVIGRVIAMSWDPASLELRKGGRKCIIF